MNSTIAFPNKYHRRENPVGVSTGFMFFTILTLGVGESVRADVEPEEIEVAVEYADTIAHVEVGALIDTRE